MAFTHGSEIMYVRNHIGPPVRGKEPTRPEKDLSCVVLGLMNGTTGVLVDIIFEPDNDPLEIRYVIVDFPKVASRPETLRKFMQIRVNVVVRTCRACSINLPGYWKIT